VKVETASPADAEEISALIIELSQPFYVSPSRTGAEPFIASISPEAERSYISADNFSFYVARSKSQLAGVVALRDNSHLFHLFVARAFQGNRLARQLWNIVKSEALQAGNHGSFTVNSSLNAIPIYEKFGFICQGEIQRMHGISFQRMQLSGKS
jgi:GNAT superfamily N-acetyltransferase